MSVEIIEINKGNIEEYGLFCKKSQKRKKDTKIRLDG